MPFKRRHILLPSFHFSLSTSAMQALLPATGKMIVPKCSASKKDGHRAAAKRTYGIRNDIREAAMQCHKTKVSKSKRLPNRPRSSTHIMSTRGVTTQQSRDAVMDTAELFEAILLQLPLSDLITYRSVNKTWFQTIHNSPKLMQKLFLSPTPADTHPLWIYNHHHATLATYSTRNEDIRAIKTESQFKAYELWRKQHFMMRPSLLNPILLTTDPPHLRGPLLRRASLCESIRFRFAPDLRKRSKPNIYHEMYLTQPPVEEIQVQFFYHLDKSNRRGRPLTTGAEGLVVKRPGGVRFRDLLMEFVDHVEAVSVLLPSSGYHVECRPEKRYKSVVYLLGAVFADEGEVESVEGVQEGKGISPMVGRLMRRDGVVGVGGGG
ncbi:hypothetical protein CLAFUW4_11501, partial [Fulvia fulva]